MRRFSASDRSGTRLAPILATLAGLASYGVMDGLMKAGAIALGAYGATFWRNLIGIAVMMPFWLARRRRHNASPWPSAAIWRLHIVRAATSALMAILFFYGTVTTPLAEAMALSFLAPLVALFLAALLLGEKVGKAAYAGSLLALGGVGVIAAGKVGAHHSPGAFHGMLAILASAVLYAGQLILQRKQAQVTAPEDIAFFQTLLIASILGCGAWWLAPIPVGGQWLLLGSAAFFSVLSLMLVGWAYARAETSVLVPLEYTAFIWAAIYGWSVFGEPVGWRTLAGVALIVTGCLVAVRHRRVDPMPA